MKFYFLCLLPLIFAPLFNNSYAVNQAKLKCPICGMEFTANPKATFTSSRGKKEIQFCSFSCAYRFHATNPKIEMTVPDYLTGASVAASQAYFLVRSKKILSEIEFDMPPTVVAFTSKENAEKVQKRLGDGKILLGFDAAIKEYN